MAVAGPARPGRGGVLFSLYLTSIELFVLHAICRWCVGSAAIITLIFVVALLDWRRVRA